MPTLLLADDSVTIQRVIELTFADEDIDVITVGDGQRAIDRIESDRPDIVLADIGMPERDGYEVSAFVKQHPQLSHVPVILLTGAFERIDEQRARAVGADGVLAKPFEPQAVISQVRDLLARRPAPAPPPPAAEPAPAPVPAPPPALLAVEPPSPAFERPMPEQAPASAWAPEALPPTAAQPPADSLDEYFDRLDAAFANLGVAPGPEAEPRAPDLPLQREAPAERPSREAPRPFGRAPEPGPVRTLERAAPLAVSGDAAPPPETRPEHPALVRSELTFLEARPAPRADTPPAKQAPAPASVPSPPPLADAFAALLAAEQGRPAPPPGPAQPAAPSSVVLSDELVEQVTRRVLERMTDRVVRETVGDLVLQVADRLIREEIERIKAAVR